MNVNNSELGEKPISLPEEGGSNAEHHCAFLMARVPAVVHIPYYRAVRGHDWPCPGCGNAQKEHGLAAQELSDAGSQDFPAISLSIQNRRDFKEFLKNIDY